MAEGSGDTQALVKIAVFCIAFSIFSTAMVTWFIQGSPDYDYDTIGAYRSELVDFSGGQLVNDTPWILKHVYTPFIPGSVDDEDIANHIEYDNGRGGWLFGSEITNYSDLNKAVDIHLDKNQKSNQLLTVGTPYDYEYRNGKAWWNGGNDFGIVILDADWMKTIFSGALYKAPIVDDEGYGYEMVSGTANNWNYTGYRYVFDPALPFSSSSSSKDGRLSLVWYSTSTDTGLSGALEIYGSNGDEQVLLGHYSAYDIVRAFQSSTGYTQVFDFDFEGTHLNLTIRFSPLVYNNYASLMDAWNDGAWTLAISSASAGNFFDVENSNAFMATGGSMFESFIDIYTFKTPDFSDNPAVNVIIWLICGLPMTIGLLCVTARVIGGVFKIF